MINHLGVWGGNRRMSLRSVSQRGDCAVKTWSKKDSPILGLEACCVQERDDLVETGHSVSTMLALNATTYLVIP